VKRLAIILFARRVGAGVPGHPFHHTGSGALGAGNFAAANTAADQCDSRNFVTESTNAAAPFLGETLLRDYADPKRRRKMI
jgi:hypothetical protein